VAVLPGEEHLLVRWLGDRYDSLVLPSAAARIESADHVPEQAGDAFGLLPAG